MVGTQNNKKRKASALSQDPRSPSLRDRHNHSSKVPSETTEDKYEEVVGEDEVTGNTHVPFVVRCPAKPRSRSKVKGKPRSDRNILGAEIEDGGFQNLAISFSIRPGNKWKNMKSFRNFVGMVMTLIMD